MPYLYNRSWFPNDIRILGTIHGLRSIELPTDKYAYKYGTLKEQIKEFIKYYFKGAADIVNKKNLNSFNELIKTLDEFCCDSEHSKYSILRVFPGVGGKSVNVYYPPQKHVEAIETSDSYSFDISKNRPYLLIIGGDRWIKNSYRALIALNNLYKSGFLKDIYTITIGKSPSSILKEFSQERRFIFKDYVSPLELELLYKNCEVFIYPTLNEGFGYPPLEAMRYGRTCVVSAVCSLPEICGDVVYYVNPYDIGEMKTRILQASIKKIDPVRIAMHLKAINKRQDEDIYKICKFIVT
jgi:glycosyltransferase involved in cell wall biosynthesis